MAKIETGWTMGQVRGLLGGPDDVLPPNDPRKYTQVGETTWCYGANGHHTLPTLGYVVFHEEGSFTWLVKPPRRVRIESTMRPAGIPRAPLPLGYFKADLRSTGRIDVNGVG